MRYLFLKREEGWLDMPKGHIERGESPEDAAIREAKEETGLTVRLVKGFRDDRSYWFVFKKERIRKQLYMFLASVDANATPRVSWEHKSYVWLTYDEAMKKISFGDQREMLERANEYIKRLDEMEGLNHEYRNLPKTIKKWGLSRSFVPGEGPLDAKVMFVGQAPGRNEDEQKRPFVGMSGKLLDRLIKLAGLNRRNVYICSVVQFFPPLNRAPTYDEIENCRGFLLRQIEIVNPKIIVLLGSIASKTLANIESIVGEHGRLIEKNKRRYFVTLHPAAAVRLKKHIPAIEADFKKLKGIVKGV